MMTQNADKNPFHSVSVQYQKYASEVFVDATHVKARANNKMMQKRIAHKEALFFEDMLKKKSIRIERSMVKSH